MNVEDYSCKLCKYVTADTDKHGDTTYHCGRYPPTIINSASPAVFPKILPHWRCGEYSQKLGAQ